MDACPDCVQARAALAQEFQTLRPLFAALGDETRQLIFLTLLESDQVGLRVGELAQRTHLSRASLSRHLRVLCQAEVVRVHREGTRNYYYANADTSQWSAFQSLADLVAAVVQNAVVQGYPDLDEH